MPRPKTPRGLKPKDLIGLPWRVAFALQADGWWLRSDIIWHKPNPMPESATDRTTKAHEYLFLLSKSARYYYDADAVRETTGNELTQEEYAARISPGATWKSGMPDGMYAGSHKMDGWRSHPSGRNRRSVWTIPTEAYSEAHFATFPRKLVEPCILAGTSEKGCCPECGTPWRRVVERERAPGDDTRTPGEHTATGQNKLSGARMQEWLNAHPRVATGWEPGCECDAGDPVPCVVLDPFMGSGTVGAVACPHGRNFIGIELNPEYVAMAERRIGKALRPATYRDETKVEDAPLFEQVQG